jgi:2-polyprenyl-3-methyl-5-hydroxy-6-metoxy-1,4-benzoquinol methylase
MAQVDPDGGRRRRLGDRIEPCLSVVMPCYNEAATVAIVLARVLESPYVREVVVVDDGSTDGTLDIVRGIDDERLRVFAQPINLGKGAALRRGFQEVTSDFVIVQDADLEYDPSEYGTVLDPLIEGVADVVYGSRFLGKGSHRVLYYWHSLGNRFLTTASNMLTDLNLTDMETCYKAFRREVIQAVDIQEDRFGFEPEITAKVARAGCRIYEVGISYAGRTYDEGKKIGWRDGVRAIYSIVRYSPLVERVNGHPVVREEGPAAFDESDAELAAVLDSLQDADNYADWIYDLCAPHLGTEVLEIGAGHGELTQRLVPGRFVTATDLSKRCVEELQTRYEGLANVDVRHADIAALGDDRKYDSIVLINVLEHIADDLGALRDLRELLKPGGRLLVFSPAFDGLYSDFDHKIGHFRRYRRSQLVTVADRAGLEYVDARYVNSIGAFAWWLFARRLRQTPTQGWSVKLYDRVVVPTLRKIEARREPGLGQSVFLVAANPVETQS